MDLKKHNIFGVNQAELHTDEIWCEFVKTFEVIGQNVI